VLAGHSSCSRPPKLPGVPSGSRLVHDFVTDRPLEARSIAPPLPGDLRSFDSLRGAKDSPLTLTVSASSAAVVVCARGRPTHKHVCPTPGWAPAVSRHRWRVVAWGPADSNPVVGRLVDSIVALAVAQRESESSKAASKIGESRSRANRLSAKARCIRELGVWTVTCWVLTFHTDHDAAPRWRLEIIGQSRERASVLTDKDCERAESTPESNTRREARQARPRT
jgi:hypothetical protein